MSSPNSATAASRRGSISALVALAAVLAASLFVFDRAGKRYDEMERAAEAQARQTLNLVALKVAAEPLTVTMPKELGVTRHGEVADYRYWSYVTTPEWLIVNGPWGTRLCEPVLGQFIEANASGPVWSDDLVDPLSEQFRGQAVQLWAHVPRFVAAPAQLDQCTGFAFDAATGRLLAAGKPVAVLAQDQPWLQAQIHGVSERSLNERTP